MTAQVRHLTSVSFVQITCPELQKDILLLEEQEGSVNFKIGIMLMRPGQKTDDEMLSNGKKFPWSTKWQERFYQG